MPETNEGIKFDDMGICQACQSLEVKMHIDWKSRQKQLEEILDKYRDKDGTNYDCMVPISGGKDSAFQLHVIKNIYKMKPLAVTFNHNWYSETGKFNLWNILEKLNIDHIMFTPNREIINKLAKYSLKQIGDACWHCHAGVGAFVLQIACKFKIPLIIWGESVSEESGRSSHKEPIKYDRDTFTKISAKVYPEQMVNDEISVKDLRPFELPSYEDVEKAGIIGIYLSDYMFWDAERQVEFLKKEYGWREDNVEGTYKGYKSVECIMPGMHDYTKFLKRGFGRSTDHVSQDTRVGLMTREEGFDIIKKHDPKRPEIYDYYLKITGLTDKEFYKIMEDHRFKVTKKLPRFKDDPYIKKDLPKNWNGGKK
jgi:N-acetyl sugar amidotransferase